MQLSPVRVANTSLQTPDGLVRSDGPATERLEEQHLSDDLKASGPAAFIDELCLRQRLEWQQGQRVLVEEYLRQHPHLNDDPGVIALIYGEFLLLEERGEDPCLEDFQKRFPGHAWQLEQQVRLHRQLAALMQSAHDGSTKRERVKVTVAAPPEASASLPAVEGYEILSELGRGGMGVVYQARQLGLNRIVALKMIRGGAFADSAALDRFREEAELIAKLQHPNIVQVFTVGTQHSPLGEAFACPFFVQEFVDGGSLAQWLAGKPQASGPVAQFVEQLARAVHFAHARGIVHRDLKPANILLMRAEDATDPLPLRAYEPKITDFGLAKELDAGGGTRTADGVVLGTPEYMAPEQALTAATAGPPADVYALGVILYEMLTGRRPHEGANTLETLLHVRQLEPVPPSRLQPKTPRDLETICLKCLRKEPEKRYPSALTLAEDLARFLAGEPIRARPVGAVERGLRWARRRPAVAALAGLVVFTFFAGATGITIAWLHALAGWGEAHHQRMEALGQRADAEEQRQLAVVEQGKAEQRRAEAETTLYFSRIAQARLEGQLHNYAAAERLLDLCTPREGDRVERRGWEWHCLRGVLAADLLTIRAAHEPCVFDLKFSPDGECLATVGGSPFVRNAPGSVRAWRIWGPDAGVRVFATQPSQLVRSVAYSQDGHVAWAGADGTLRVADAATGAVVRTAYLPAGVHTAFFAANGTRYATCDRAGQVSIWTLNDDQPLASFDVGSHAPSSLALNADGTLLATNQRHLHLWDVKSGKKLFDFPATVETAGSPTFSSDGRLLAVGSSRGLVRIFDTATGALAQSLAGHDGGVLALAFRPDGRQVATAGSDQTVRTWDVATGAELLVLRGHHGRVSCLSYHPSGHYLASGSEQPGDVKVWDLTRQQEYVNVRVAAGHDGHIETIGFSRDSDLLQFTCAGGWLQRTPAYSGAGGTGQTVNVSRRWLVPSVQTVLRPDGQQLATVGRDEDRTVYLIDAANSVVQHSFTTTQEVTHLAYSRDGSHVAVTAIDWRQSQGKRELTIRDTSTGELQQTFTSDRLSLTVPHGVAALSHDGRLVAHDDYRTVASEGKRGWEIEVRIRDVATGQTLHKLTSVPSVVRCLAFSPDDHLLAVATESHGILLYDCRNNALLFKDPLNGSDAETQWDVAFNPAGDRLAAASRTQVQLWDVATGHRVLTLRGAPPRNKDVGFNPRVVWSPDGQRLAGNNWNRTVSIWDAAERQSIAAKQAQHQAAEQRAQAR